MFRTPERDGHVHVWRDADPEIARHVRFRDRLRALGRGPAACERLKREPGKSIPVGTPLNRCAGLGRGSGQLGSCGWTRSGVLGPGEGYAGDVDEGGVHCHGVVRTAGSSQNAQSFGKFCTFGVCSQGECVCCCAPRL